MNMHRKIILGEVEDERRRQIAKWGLEHQTHPHNALWPYGVSYWRKQMPEAKRVCDSLTQDEITWEHILFEEVAEALSETDWAPRRKELIQVMAVCCAEIEDGDKKERLKVLADKESVLEREAAMERHPASRTRAQAEYECDECDTHTPNSVVDGVLLCDQCRNAIRLLTQVSSEVWEPRLASHAAGNVSYKFERVPDEPERYSRFCYDCAMGYSCSEHGRYEPGDSEQNAAGAST